MNPCCFDCKYFCPEAGKASVDDLAEKDWNEAMPGECRRHAPRVGQYLGEDHPFNSYDYGQWPMVQASNWCGEFVLCERAQQDQAKEARE